MGGTLDRCTLRLPITCWCDISLHLYISNAAACHLWLWGCLTDMLTSPIISLWLPCYTVLTGLAGALLG